MATIVTSDCTVPTAMSSPTNTGSAKRAASPAGSDGRRAAAVTRPSARNRTTGIATVPISPSGSRTKILISSQVSFQRPLNTRLPNLLPYRVSRDLEEDLLERRDEGTELGHADPVLGQH